MGASWVELASAGVPRRCAQSYDRRGRRESPWDDAHRSCAAQVRTAAMAVKSPGPPSSSWLIHTTTRLHEGMTYAPVPVPPTHP